MELSFEIPMPHLHEFIPLSDFTFGLAHLMLDTKFKHAGTYHIAMQGCLLDNSMYELKDEPLTNEQLIEAADICSPCAIIAPDWQDDMKRTINATEALHKVALDYMARNNINRFPWDIGGVVQGKDISERIECFNLMKHHLHCSPICFPFRTPRAHTIGHLQLMREFEEDGWYHLLGLESPWELAWKIPGRWSVDTAKPFKGKKLHKLESIRGLGRLRIHEELSEEQLRIAAWNIAWMRKLTR